MVEVLIRGRPRTTEELMSMDIPRFSKNNRTTYGAQILATLQQARNPSCCLVWAVLSTFMETRGTCCNAIDSLLRADHMCCCFGGSGLGIVAESVTVRGLACRVAMTKVSWWDVAQVDTFLKAQREGGASAEEFQLDTASFWKRKKPSSWADQRSQVVFLLPCSFAIRCTLPPWEYTCLLKLYSILCVPDASGLLLLWTAYRSFTADHYPCL